MGIVATGLGKSFGTPAVRVLSGIDLEIRDGEFVALTGRSGSGKSTLLYLLSSLDFPTAGRVEITGQDITRMTSDELHRLRNEKVGFVFQFHYLIAELSMIENVLMPALKRGEAEVRRAYAVRLLEKFGLADKQHRKPRELSGGEQQRVAIARAMVMQPKYLFADEPTGSLDSQSGDNVMKIIREINETAGTTVVMVTHDPDYARQAKRQIQLMDGRIVPAGS
jgi:lipoprotein-releasing system ATP-binding protein